MIFFPDPELLATDQRLTDRARRVYLVLVKKLDPIEYRPVKVTWVAWVLRMHRSDASKALRQLVRAGYLVKNGRDERGVFAYRIIPSPQGADTNTPHPRAA